MSAHRFGLDGLDISFTPLREFAVEDTDDIAGRFSEVIGVLEKYTKA